MTKFTCDMCGATQIPDETAANWYTAATVNGGKGVRLWRWPMGRSLQEPHDSLIHVCSRVCLHDMINRWDNREL